MSAAAERMKALRERRRANHLREVRLVTLDARSPEVQARIARQVASLHPEVEEEVIRWIEAVSIFDEPDEGEK
jgi:hypothetical protein